MSEKLSIVIPARNEIYLEKTILNVLSNATGDIEILAVLDGYKPDIHIDDARVKFIYNEVSIGQRQSINKAARQATGNYIMKLDAHCAVAKGFDTTLTNDCRYEWTMVPRMFTLDDQTWQPKLHKKVDYMYISSPTWEEPFRMQYYEGRTLKDERQRPPRSDAEIDDIMCCLGACFFMHMKRFWELGGCDEGHKCGWGQQGIEVSLKAWLSGGALKVNKRTWFAHRHRREGFPYHITNEEVDQSRQYSQNLWLKDKWPLAKVKFGKIARKFNAPHWWEYFMHENSMKLMKAFADQYYKGGKVLDIGSRVVKGQEHFGTYRDLFNDYTGLDIGSGNNVDISVHDEYHWTIPDEAYDYVISGQTMEHVEYTWLWIKEIARILKPGGLCCIIAPAVIHEHKYPIDCYRFYPDGMRALAKWAGLEVISAERTRDGKLEDTCLIAKKK